MNVYQNDLPYPINKIACYFCSIANANTNQDWTPQELNRRFERCKNLKYIDANDCIASPGNVANILETGLVFIGKFYTDYVPKEGDYIIMCFKMTPDAVDAHFVVHDGSGIYTKEHVAYDPWAGGSKTVREGMCTSLRVFRRNT